MSNLPLHRLPMTKAVKVLLAEVTGWPWEIRAIPRAPNSSGDMVASKAPFGILYPMWSEYGGPAFDQPEADPVWHYQATVSVDRGDQAEWAHDRIVEAIVGRDDTGSLLHPLVVDGMLVMIREMTDENDTADTALSHDIRFALHVTPAPVTV